jgi:biotin--protein ligase
MKRFMTSIATKTASMASKKTLYIIGKDQATSVKISSDLSKLPQLMEDLQISTSLAPSTPDNSTPYQHLNQFSTDRYKSGLNTKIIGQNLLYSPLLQSTQTVMQDVNNVVPTGTVCVADQQTAGRGRGSNAWYSPPGCLLFSFTFSTKNGGNLPFAQYLLSLALVKAVRAMPNCNTIPVKIKWPNDIYAEQTVQESVPVDTEELKTNNTASTTGTGTSTTTPTPLTTSTANTDTTSSNETKIAATTEYSSFVLPPKHGHYSKIGGVLCESSYDYNTKSFIVIAGIGLNATNTTPTTCLKSLSGDNENIICRETVLSSFFNEFEPMLEEFNVTGFNNDIKNNYVKEWLHSGQNVTVCDLNGRRKEGKPAPSCEDNDEDRSEVTIIGIAESSGLLAIDSKGRQFELLPDGNSFDFLKGLIKRKI